jgi:dipeptidyl aminopeptidase/acylaminoacyl peptidase
VNHYRVERSEKVRWLRVRVCVVVCVATLLTPGAASSGQSHPKRPVTVEDQQSLRESFYMQLSPDGKMLVYVLGTDYFIGEDKGEIWLVETKAGSAPRKLLEGTVPMWSPDSKQLAYYSTRSGSLQLWVMDLASGRTTQVTNLAKGIDPDPYTNYGGFSYAALRYSWSPDGMKIVFASQVALENHVTREEHEHRDDSPPNAKAGRPLVLTSTTPAEWTLQGVFRYDLGPHRVGSSQVGPGDVLSLPPQRFNQLFVVDLASKKVDQVTKDEQIYFNPDWSPDGRQIVCASSDGHSLLGQGPGTTNIYAIELRTGIKRSLTTGEGDKRLPFWSPDGRWVAFMGGEYLGAHSVFVVPSQGGSVVNVTAILDRNVQEFFWSSNSESLVLSYQDGVSWRIARANIRGKELRQIADEQAAFRWPLTVARVQTIAWQQSDGSSHGVIHVVQRAPQPSYVLVDLNPQVKDWALGMQEVVRWKNKRGEELEGILIKPAGYRTDRKYPLIVDCYPQTANGFMGGNMGGSQALAARGYLVFYLNPRGPHVWINPFKGTAYDQAAKGPKGWDVTFDDVMSGVDEIERRGIADPDRLGLFGFSNGAAVVNYLLTRTKRFKCAVSVAGALGVDWSLPFFLSTSNPIIAKVVGATPWENPNAYIELSILYSLNKVATPLLMADGDDDGFFLLTDIEMYNALRWFGKDVTFLRYSGQGHGFTGEALKDFWERETQFFDRYLRPE